MTSTTLMSINEGCDELCLGRTKLYELITSGEIETVKIGKRRLIVRASIPRLITRLAQQAVA